MISDDGRYITFQSQAQLVAEDTDTSADAYLLDRDADGDGLFEGCASDSTLTLLNSAPPEVDANLKHTSQAQLSADGRVSLFNSDATNLVPGDTNGVRDVFVKDLTNGTVTRVSVSSDGTQQNDGTLYPGPNLSRDGRFAAFNSTATNLVGQDLNGIQDGFRTTSSRVTRSGSRSRTRARKPTDRATVSFSTAPSWYSRAKPRTSRSRTGATT